MVVNKVCHPVSHYVVRSLCHWVSHWIPFIGLLTRVWPRVTQSDLLQNKHRLVKKNYFSKSCASSKWNELKFLFIEVMNLTSVYGDNYVELRLLISWNFYVATKSARIISCKKTQKMQKDFKQAKQLVNGLVITKFLLSC